jgi:uncharacterized phiE125 gp8 family phage protein
MSNVQHSTKSYQMRARVTVAPAIQPVSLDEVKQHLRITATSEDAYLNSLIEISTDLLQEFCHRKFIQQTITGWLDAESLMNTWWEGSIVAAINAIASLRTIELPWTPAINVTSVSMFTLADEELIVDPDTYRVDAVDLAMPTRITLKESAVWPGGAYRNQNSLKVVWLSGYGPAMTDVPPGLRMAIKQLIAYLYNNRGDCSGDCVGACGAKALAQTYKVYTL